MDDTEEILKRLKDQGIPVGSWQDRPKAKVEMPILTKQKALLTALKGLLQSQQDQDMNKLADLQDALSRLEKAREVARGRE